MRNVCVCVCVRACVCPADDSHAPHTSPSASIDLTSRSISFISVSSSHWKVAGGGAGEIREWRGEEREWGGKRVEGKGSNTGEQTGDRTMRERVNENRCTVDAF